MGEETKKEEPKVETKQEEKKEEKKDEKENAEKAEEKKEEVKPSPPQPTVLSVELHCVGCAKKIERIILRCKGVEDVEVDMANNQVTIKGAVDAQAVCSRIQKKTFRQAVLLSPLPTPPAEAETKPEVAVEPQVTAAETIELHVNMHCEACAEQLKKKILKMRGVQTAETNLTAAKVTVTGTMTGEKLVEYIYRRTGKIAKVIPPPPKEPEPEKKTEEEKPAEEKKDGDTAEKKEDEKSPEQKENAEAEANKEQKDGDVVEEPKKEVVVMNDGSYYIHGHHNHEDPEMTMMKRMMYWNGGMMNDHDMMVRPKMMPWMPMYMMERPSPFVVHEQPMPMMIGRPPFVIGQPAPPPQIFSDENPNACSIS